ncbi:MAG: hypothetical protein NAOJABEB_02965 [Steroidobacteraceae bacterium]|nr:hypothetical protein [Steroidobacteraceae bacterium]
MNATAGVLEQLFALRQLDKRYQSTRHASSPHARYIADPAAYAREVLGVAWWHKQVEVAEALTRHARVLVRASHSVGKTHVAGGIVNWWYDVADPSICLTTAPTDRQVQDLLWKEVRVQRRGRPGLLPKAARMESSPDHYAVGYTARDVNAFQGTHEERLLIVFDEAVGVGGEFWEGADAMLTSGPENRMLAIYNPTDTASAVYQAELDEGAQVIVISALDHPNIAAELRGDPPPFPKAVRLSWVAERVAGWCSPILPGDAKATDLEWPPGSGDWHRPGPLFESRVMGLWPSQAINSVWSEAAFSAATTADLPEPTDEPCEIGCDVARFGDDNTTMHVRRGGVSLWHEAHNGWGTDQTAGRLKELAREYGRHCGVDGREVAVKVDDDGVGGGVVDQREDYSFRPVNAGSLPVAEEDYPNRRSELWFVTAERAAEGSLDLSRLSRDVLADLRRQCMAPTWRVDARGRRVVEPKAETKKRIGRSPDDADALNLAYAYVPPPAGAVAGGNVPILRAYGTDRRELLRRSIR